MIKYKTIYLYRDSSMPENGWQHPCFCCYSITANTVDYKTIQKVSFNPRYSKYLYNYVVYKCRPCEKKMLVDEQMHSKFVRRCDRYIRENSI